MTFEFPIVLDGVLQSASSTCEGLAAGTGVFETLPVEARHGILWSAHRERLRRAASVLGLDWPGDECLEVQLETMLAAVAASPGAPGSWVLRVSLTRKLAGGATQLLFEGRELVRPDAAGVSLWIGPEPHPLGAWSGLKRTPRTPLDQARAAAQAAGCYDALLAGPGGELVEGCISNLFLIQGHTLSTPRLSSGCLDGIQRGLLLESLAKEPLQSHSGVQLRVRECALSMTSLATADEVFLTNSVGRVIRVSALVGPEGPGHQLMRSPGGWCPLLERRATRIEADHRAP